ncbi:fatty acid-binding protein-like [Oppia nitens]|uniref:fatty acid-binding protein-like n=1 Tax=Oppia nitens TaxID=1686743 RepID=UPI0023DBB67C|nr:fatty acid-binding protein-like [Oppia nitens]XP_054158680.1 fatty acid-binding protein-like [Oppia nitens]
MATGDFSKTYTFKSSDNVLAFAKARGVPDDGAAIYAAAKPTLEVSKKGDQFTIRRVFSEGRAHDISFELGKEFDETRPNGQTVKSVVVAGEGKQLIQTQKGDKEVKIVYDFNGDDVVSTATITGEGVSAKWVFSRNQ